ncbi:hypothetical protein Ae201684P_005573 [Aphanomyces euteiches]|uniref:Uncharacterized protein n=1 Tax=Aphanomyces euteiches TaxID=100861 RepID=A0A6G0X3S6_9STRA|nr:hypothetical protein Ae201684_008821 [Aphanomyces euteiches]KAH9085875.1 hypothetical protein Ae201684P_005573 [Aphanomyces euteiches]
MELAPRRHVLHGLSEHTLECIALYIVGCESLFSFLCSPHSRVIQALAKICTMRFNPKKARCIARRLCFVHTFSTFRTLRIIAHFQIVNGQDQFFNALVASSITTRGRIRLQLNSYKLTDVAASTLPRALQVIKTLAFLSLESNPIFSDECAAKT